MHVCGKILVPAHMQKQDKHKKQGADVHRREQNTTHTHNITITLQPYVHLHLIYPFQPSEFLTLHPVQHCDGARVRRQGTQPARETATGGGGVNTLFWRQIRLLEEKTTVFFLETGNIPIPLSFLHVVFSFVSLS